MIVRILEEGQLEVPSAVIDELNTLDDDLLAAVETGDEAAFSKALSALLGKVREAGTPVDDDYLGPSEVFLPAGHATLEEVKALLADDDPEGDGFIPG
jgi:hypothetical protein